MDRQTIINDIINFLTDLTAQQLIQLLFIIDRLLQDNKQDS